MSYCLQTFPILIKSEERPSTQPSGMFTLPNQRPKVRRPVLTPRHRSSPLSPCSPRHEGHEGWRQGAPAWEAEEVDGRHGEGVPDVETSGERCC